MVARVKDVESDDGTPWAGFAERKRIAAEMKASGETIKTNRGSVEGEPDHRVAVVAGGRLQGGRRSTCSYLWTERHSQTRALMDEALATSLQAICSAAGEGDAKVALGYVRTLLSYQAATS